MRRGLPKDGASPRMRRAGPPARARATAGASKAPWWHATILWLLFAVSLVALRPDFRPADEPSVAYVRSAVISHTFGTGLAAPAGPVFAPAVLWSPFVLAAHAGVTIARSRGSLIAADGVSWPYVWAFAGGTAIYGFLGLWMSCRLARRVASPGSALLATVAVWLGSALPVYIYLLPFSAHVASMFAAALVLTIWMSIRDGRDSRVRWLAFGAAAGLAVAASVFNAALLLVALLEIATSLLRSGRRAQALVNVLLFLAGAAVIAVPAFVLDRPSLDFQWAATPLISAVIETGRVALLWTPVVMIGAIGCLFAIRRQPAVGATLFVTAILLVVLAAARGGATSAPFGNAWLLALTPILVWGVAVMADVLAASRGRLAWTVVVAAAALVVAWNFGLMFQWATGLVPASGPANLRAAAVNQVTVVPGAATNSVIRYLSERAHIMSQPGAGR